MFAFSPQAFSVQAFSPAAFAIDAGGTQPAVPPAPTFGMGGQRISSSGGAGRSRYKRDDELTWMTGGGR
ncbi:MAG: hypothetical protein MOGMAGMI_02404 [Candidatus Omnitrophica bacterium]|nr:hypothetical protein [Candidatus Omnitrophota bacterium]